MDQFDELGAIVDSGEEDDFASHKQQHQATKPIKSIRDQQQRFREQDRIKYMTQVVGSKRDDFSYLKISQIAEQLKNIEDTNQIFHCLNSLIQRNSEANYLYLLKNSIFGYLIHIQRKSIHLNELYQIFNQLSALKEFKDYVQFEYVKESVELSFKQLQLMITYNQLIYLPLMEYYEKIYQCEQLRMAFEKCDLLGLIWSQSFLPNLDQKLGKVILDLIAHIVQSPLSNIAVAYQVANLWIHEYNIDHSLETIKRINDCCNEQTVSAVLETNIIPYLMKILVGQDQDRQYNTLNRINQIAQFGLSSITQTLINQGIQIYIEKFSYHKFQKFRTISLQILVGLTKSNLQSNTLIVNEQVFGNLQNILVSDKNINKILVLKVFSNLVSFPYGDFGDSLIQQGIVRLLRTTFDTDDIELLIWGVKFCEKLMDYVNIRDPDTGLNNLLESMQQSQIIIIIEDLMKHQNQDVYNTASTFLMRYFELM